MSEQIYAFLQPNYGGERVVDFPGQTESPLQLILDDLLEFAVIDNAGVGEGTRGGAAAEGRRRRRPPGSRCDGSEIGNVQKEFVGGGVGGCAPRKAGGRHQRRQGSRRRRLVHQLRLDALQVSIAQFRAQRFLVYLFFRHQERCDGPDAL